MYERLIPLIGEETLDKIKDKKILLVGLGGVGGACFEALVRLGFKNFHLIDNDTFDITNLNRQILCTKDNIGHKKVIEAQIRAKNISDDINIKCDEIFLNEDNITKIDYHNIDYIIDCQDTLKTKLLLIEKSLEHNIKIISSMGTGNRLDPTKLIITDIWKTENDPLAKKLRSLLRKSKIKTKVPVITSKEIPVKINNNQISSCSLVPNVAGFYLAYYILNDIINN